MKKIIFFLIVVAISVLTFWSEESFILETHAQTGGCFQGTEKKEITDDNPFADDPPALCIDRATGRIDAGVNREVVISGNLWDDCARGGAPYVWLRINWGDGIDWEQKEYTCVGELSENFRFSHNYTSVRETPYSITLVALDTEPNTTTVRWQCYVSATPPPGGGGGGDLTIGTLDLWNPFGESCQTINCIIEKIISFIFTVAVILLPLLVITGGIMFLTAVGDPARIKNAKKLILYAFIGFSIILLSKLFIELLKQIFKVKTGT